MDFECWTSLENMRENDHGKVRGPSQLREVYNCFFFQYLLVNVHVAAAIMDDVRQKDAGLYRSFPFKVNTFQCYGLFTLNSPI